MTSLSVPAIRGSGRPLGAPGLMLCASIALAVAVVLSLSVGATGVSLAALPRVLAALATGVSDPTVAREQLVLLEIRLPRLLLGRLPEPPSDVHLLRVSCDVAPAELRPPPALA